MTIEIPLFRVRMDPAVPEAIARTIGSGTVTEGPRVVELELRLTELFGVPALAVNSGTSALHLAAIVAGVRPGDEVISTPITCAATNLAIVHAGGTIVWADVDPSTGLIDPEDVARKVTPRTRAVMAVEWGGAPVDVVRLREAAGVPVIVDAAHAFGAPRGSEDVTCWSFQAIKHLTTGDGGALGIRDEVWRERARKLRWFGIDRRAPGANIDKPIHEAGFKYHMNDLAASIGLANFHAALQSVDQHRANAAWYDEHLAAARGIQRPPRSAASAWWLYTIVLERDRAQADFIAHMASRGIECSRVHSRNDRHPAFDAFRPAHELPGVTWFDEHQIAIPVGWWVDAAARDKVAQAVLDWRGVP